ncbi:MAG: hypothetical protein WCO67_24595 [Betaproteobacteria bacterium]
MSAAAPTLFDKLIYVPPTDGNFTIALLGASELELLKAVDHCRKRGGERTRRALLEARLKRVFAAA